MVEQRAVNTMAPGSSPGLGAEDSHQQKGFGHGKEEDAGSGGEV